MQQNLSSLSQQLEVHLMQRIAINLLLPLMLGLLLTGCNAVSNTIQRIETSEKMEDFDETFTLYSKHLRWGHFRELTTFMTQEQIGPSLAKIDSLKDRRISRVTPTAWIYDEEKGVMIGDVIIDYYITNRAVIRQTTQQQTWRLVGEEDEFWQLDSPIPDLP